MAILSRAFLTNSLEPADSGLLLFAFLSPLFSENLMNILRRLPNFLFAATLLIVCGLTVRASANETKSPQEDCAEKLITKTERNKFGHHALNLKIHINAPASLVWQAIRENRNSDPDVEYSKITELSETQRILEQKYKSLPVFGSTTCVLQLNESIHKRIDYNLIKSDRLSEFEGSWILTASENGQTTELELSNHLKLNLPIPQRLIDAFAAPKMKARISWVKALAESKQKQQIASIE